MKQYISLLLMAMAMTLTSVQTARAQELVEIGTGTEDLASPYYANRKYATSITLYKGSEIARSGDIASIAYNVTMTKEIPTDTVKIYMMMTDHADLNESVDGKGYYTTIDTDSFTLVYEGNPTLGAKEGWEKVDFDRPFAYNSSHNLLVAVTHKSSTYSSNLRYANTKTAGENRTMAYWDTSRPAFGELEKMDSIYSVWPNGLMLIQQYANAQFEFCPAPSIGTLAELIDLVYNGGYTALYDLNYDGELDLNDVKKMERKILGIGYWPSEGISGDNDSEDNVIFESKRRGLQEWLP